MRNSKIVVVCNSTNPDLVEYFKCKINTLNNSELSNSYLAFKNKKIELDEKCNSYNSSFTNSAFFDKKVPLDFLLSFKLFYIVLTQKVKVVHFTTAHISNIFLSILLKPFRVKQVFTLHDLVPHPGKKAMFINMYNDFIINFLSDEIISFSKSEINKQPKKEKFRHFLLSGFEQFSTISKVGEKTILFFGRIESYKGLDNLLDIIQKANKEDIDYKFVIAGKGNISNIEEFQKYKNVEIINRFIDDEEVEQLFKKATFTILPYDSATQSGVTILSYAYATPVITYDVGALGEYVDHGQNGFIVEYKNNEKIIEILKNTSEDEILKMSEKCIESFDAKYSKISCAEMYLGYYKELLNNKKIG